jgi:hypothetical protein
MRFKILMAATAGSLVVATPALAAPPSNDAFADAQKLPVGEEISGVLAEATAELGEPAHGTTGPHHTVWFRYHSPRDAKLTIDTGGSEVDTLLAAYTGNDVSDLHQIAADDDSSPSGNLGSTIRFNARRGRTYRIAVDSFGGDPGSGAFKVWLSDGGIKGKGVALAVDPGQTVDGVRSHGVRLTITARRRVPMAVALRVSRATAHDLGLHTRLLGRTRGRIDYNQALHATIRLKRAARRALEDADTLHGVVKLTLPRSTAPDKTLTVPVTL